ncbi:MAG: hypothetical protein AMXMBFR84_35020 [Candidatus Hydrogenedentota bacterium]
MLCSALLITISALAASPVHQAEIIFPHESWHNHSSSMVETPQGDFIAAWFHGSGERKEDDVVVMGSRLRKGESAWSEPFLMADSQDLPDCNPVLFMDPQGKLWLFWVAIQNNEWGGALLKYRTSTDYQDDGAPKWEWQDVIHTRPKDLETIHPAFLEEAKIQFKEHLASNPQHAAMIEQLKAASQDKLTSRLGWMGRIPPIMISEKKMMLGLYSDVFNCSIAAFTEDSGKTWSYSEPILELGNIQPAFIQRKDGSIICFMRDNGIPGKVKTARSDDGGVKWSKVGVSDIPNPGSSVAAYGLNSGSFILAANDLRQGRHNLTLYLSDDEGKTWSIKRSLEALPSGEGSAHYPNLIQFADGDIHCIYTFKIESQGSTIKHARFNEEWVREGEAISVKSNIPGE